jgi:hypothetical protein
MNLTKVVRIFEFFGLFFAHLKVQTEDSSEDVLAANTLRELAANTVLLQKNYKNLVVSQSKNIFVIFETPKLLYFSEEEEF